MVQMLEIKVSHIGCSFRYLINKSVWGSRYLQFLQNHSVKILPNLATK